MPHLDEGIIHAWLDGALTGDELAHAEAHTAECEICSAAVAEARGLVAASSRILSALDDVPARVIPIAGRTPEMTTAVGRGRVRGRRWISSSTMRAAAALLLVTTGTFFVVSRDQAKRDLNVATETVESADSVAAVGAASSAEEVGALKQSTPPGQLSAPARVLAGKQVKTRSSPAAEKEVEVSATMADGVYRDTTGIALADAAVAPPASGARVAGKTANQAASDFRAQGRVSEGYRREAARIGRPGSIAQSSTMDTARAALLASPAAAERDAAAVSAFAGCYEIRLGAWTPALNLGADTVYVRPPRRIVLETLPATTPSDPSSLRVRPVLDTPGPDKAGWLALGADSLRISWTTGLNGLTMRVRLENETLSGVATTFWNFDRTSQQSKVTGTRIACR